MLVPEVPGDQNDRSEANCLLPSLDQDDAMPTVALILPTSSYRGPDFVAAAEELGVDLVVVTDGTLPLTARRIAAEVVADCEDADKTAAAVVQFADAHLIEAVIGVDDAGVVAASIAASTLGLPHNDPEAVRATRDKLLMRRTLATAEVAQPGFTELEVGADAASAGEEVGFPLVVKPRSLSGSRGVMKVEVADELADAVHRVASINREAGRPDESLLLEEFVGGPEIAVEALLDRDGLEVLAVFDKPDPLDGPFFEETIYVSPSRHPSEALAGAVECVQKAAHALGLAFGPVHAEVRMGPDGPRLIEVAARSIGGLCGRSLRFGMLSQSLEVLLLRAALGLNRRGMGPIEAASGAMMIPIPHEGVLRAVRNREAVAEVEGVEELTITVPIGRRIRPLPDGDRYLGFIIARHSTAAEVEAALREAHAVLDIEIESESS